MATVLYVTQTCRRCKGTGYFPPNQTQSQYGEEPEICAVCRGFGRQWQKPIIRDGKIINKPPFKETNPPERY
jgi:DnaJ-class molecular chaperone